MSYVVSFQGYTPSPRYPPVLDPWTEIQIEESADLDTWMIIDLIAISPVDADPTRPAARSFTTESATLSTGWYRVTFLDAGGDQERFNPVQRAGNAVLFATVEDVGLRMGRALTGAEEGQASLALELASGLILEEVGKDQAWAGALSAVPVAFRAVSIEMAARLLNNPASVDRLSRTIGSISWSGSFGSTGFGLTDMEKSLVVIAVYGTDTGSARADSLITELGGVYDSERWFPNDASGVGGIYDDA